MPRAMWSGAISFGLVSIPVKAYPATEEKSLSFRQLHEKDNTRIHYERACEKGHKDIPYDEIVKGYEHAKGEYVILTDEDFEAVPAESTKTVDVAYFIDPAEIDPVQFERSYYLAAGEGGAKAYVLMREALEKEGRYAVGKVAFREKEHLAVIRVFDGKLLVMHTMHWPDEIRDAGLAELDRSPKVSPRELDMARNLVRNLTEPWNPKDFRDEYRKALMKVVEKKIAGEEITFAPEAQPEPVADLMEALRKSVEASKRREAEKPKKRTRRKAS